MSEELNRLNADCDYCGRQLDARVYFCPSCAKPQRPVEQLLTPSAPAFESIETDLRTKAPDVWTVFFGFLSAMIVAAFTGMAIWGRKNMEPTMLLMDFTLFVTTAVFLCRYWNEVKPFLSRAGIFKSATWIGLVILAPLLVVNYGYHSFLVEWLGIEMENYNDIFTSPYGAIIFICVMPALVEEVAFRGIIQQRFESIVSPWVAIGAASVLFSAAHFSIFSAPYLAVVGVLLGWMKWKTGSLYPPMVAHFLHNYIVVSYLPT